ncbi:MAG: MOSC domain-containing protein [Actinobacteria bacterium]|nr:MOSC domain-containing protein [Actinomycetota bacterium]
MAILVGRPSTHTAPSGRVVTTAFRKHVVDGPLHVGSTNVEGDEQADLRNHGGPDKAVLACSADHGEFWRELDPVLAEPGAFGENLHVGGLAEAEVCIGDRWRVGTVELQVSQPRRPCWKVEDRWRREGLVDLMERTGRTGWYLRVLQTGVLEAGDVWHLLERPNPVWTVAAANEVVHHRRDDRGAAAALAELPELSASWRRTLRARVDRLDLGAAEDAEAVEASRRRGPS